MEAETLVKILVLGWFAFCGVVVFYFDWRSRNRMNKTSEYVSIPPDELETEYQSWAKEKGVDRVPYRPGKQPKPRVQFFTP